MRLYLEITNVCNLRCAFCPGARREGRFLTAEEFRLLAARLRPHGRYLYFHVMGEPLLHPRLSELLEIAGELDFRVILTTNGVLLPERRDALLAAPALHKVNLSLHAPEANGGAVALPEYLDGCADFVEKASARGILCSMRLWNQDGPEAVGYNARNGEILRFFETVFPPPWTPNTRGMRLRDRVFLEFDRRFQWPGGAALRDAGFCRALREQTAVLCDGTVVPCCLDGQGEIALGNLFRQELRDILEGPRAKKLAKGFAARRLEEPLCRTCGYAARFDRA